MARVLMKCKTQNYTLIDKRVTSYKPKLVGLKSWASLVAQMVKNLPAMQETWVWSLDWEDPMEEGLATHSSILAWRIPWTEEPGGLQSVGWQRARHNWVTNTHTHTLKSYCSVQRGLVKTQNADPTTPYRFVWNDFLMDEVSIGAKWQRVDCAGPHWSALTIWTLSHSAVNSR